MGRTNSALTKPQCPNRFRALSPSFDCIPTCAHSPHHHAIETSRTTNTSSNFMTAEIFKAWYSQTDSPKNFQHVITSQGNQPIAGGLSRNTSANDRISSQSAAPGFPDLSQRENKRSAVNLNASNKQIAISRIHFCFMLKSSVCVLCLISYCLAMSILCYLCSKLTHTNFVLLSLAKSSKTKLIRYTKVDKDAGRLS